MELSIREAKARFTEAATAAARGERVVITKHGVPFIEFVPAAVPVGMEWDKAEAARVALGLEGTALDWPAGFDDPALSRRVLGLED